MAVSWATFNVPQEGPVKLEVFDSRGRRVAGCDLQDDALAYARRRLPGAVAEIGADQQRVGEAAQADQQDQRGDDAECDQVLRLHELATTRRVRRRHRCSRYSSQSSHGSGQR